MFYSDKTWCFDQSERALGRIYILNIYIAKEDDDGYTMSILM